MRARLIFHLIGDRDEVAKIYWLILQYETGKINEHDILEFLKREFEDGKLVLSGLSACVKGGTSEGKDQCGEDSEGDV